MIDLKDGLNQARDRLVEEAIAGMKGGFLRAKISERPCKVCGGPCLRVEVRQREAIEYCPQCDEAWAVPGPFDI